MKMRHKILAGTAILALIGAIAGATPVLAQEAASAAKPKNHYTMTHDDKGNDIEYRIKKLHDALGITSEQEDDFGNVASAMRESRDDMSKMMQERREQRASASAIDSLKAYEKMAQAHADSMEKFVDAFEPFYDKLPDAQKQKADAFFRKPMMGSMHGMKKMPRADTPAAAATK